jgi:exodeoxyribonuclease VII large subunit
MPITYLSVPFREREAAKSLGARWDPASRRWYVSDGRDLTPFSTWLPCEPTSTGVALRGETLSVGSAVAKKGVPLSQLLAGVTQAVATAYRAGVWTMLEVVQVTRLRGHVYLEVAERDETGAVLAKARAMIWSRVADSILPAFQHATGMEIGPGIKLLVRAKPGFHVQHGFGLEIDELDPDYTLGDLEARKREIRAQLRADGIFEANRKLPAPWDFNAVLVIAPAQAAGLGDFEAEARRLSNAGVCRFLYVASRFQGEGAAGEICAAAKAALRDWHDGLPDALVLIRGGGAVNDLAWLNDYQLARFICDAPVPVFTGLGHERDSTVLDEVAHTAFDTPSKVIAGIEGLIRSRASEARAVFEAITASSARLAALARSNSTRLCATVENGSLRHLASARERARELMVDVRHEAYLAVRDASDKTRSRMGEVRYGAVEQLADAKRRAPVLLTQVHAAAQATIGTVRAQSDKAFEGVLERSANATQRATERADTAMANVAQAARAGVAQAKTAAQALMREVAGQGPEKTLARGFALVRSANGKPVTSAERAAAAGSLVVQFHDGSMRAKAQHEE